MIDTNIDTRILDILNLDLKIEINTFKGVAFRDKSIEKLYKSSNKGHYEIFFIQGDKIIVIGWMCILFYVLGAYYMKEVALSCTACFCINFLLVFIKNSSNKKYDVAINFIQILMITLYLNLKVFYLKYLMYTRDQNHQDEILRTIIYDFVSCNLLGLIILEENLLMRLVFLSLNLSSILLCIFTSMSYYNYLVDSFTSIFYSFIFYLLKKAWEYNLRSVFAERYCLSKLLSYSNDFISELNGIHFNMNANKSLVSGKNACKVINECGLDINCKYVKNESNDKFDLLFLNNNYYELLLEKLIFMDDQENEKNVTLFEKLDFIKKNTFVTTKFINIGIFYNLFSQEKKYYEIFYRKFYITDFNMIEDMYFYDVTNYITAKQQIKEENITKQKLLAKISHEFKTPINSIIGLIETIKGAIISKNEILTYNCLDTIKNFSNYVIYLTNDIIQFSALNSHSINICKQKIDVREILKFGGDIMSSLLSNNSSKKNSVNAMYAYDEEIDKIIIHSDEVRLKQILLNFISNAVKFTKSGFIKINAELIEFKSKLKIEVIDSGVGIRNEDQIKLFNEFTIIKNKSINNNLGTGLGLSITKSLAESLNIKIKFTSVYGNGSTFSMLIPLEIACENGSVTHSSAKGVSNFVNDNQVNNTTFFSLKSALETNRKSSQSVVSMFKKNLDYPNKNKNNEMDYYAKIDECRKENSITIFPIIDFVENEENQMRCSKIKNDEVFLDIAPILSHSSEDYIDIRSNNSYIEEDLTGIFDYYPIKLNSKLNPFKTKYIVTADDNNFINLSVKNLIETILTEYELDDYEVICATDGIDILHLIKQDQANGNCIELIISDENMEYMNGSSAAKILKEFEKNGKIKYVKLVSSTCNDDLNSKESLIKSGFENILSKPLNKFELINLFKQINII